MTYRAVWKHNVNKCLFAEQPYYWCDSIVVIDETKTREVVHVGAASTFDFRNWTRCTHTELQKIKTRFKDMYE